MVEGKNQVVLQGILRFPELKETSNGNNRFQGKIAVPFTYKDRETQVEKQGSSYIKISAWGDLAVELASFPDETPIRVNGTYNERTYDSNCKSCGEAQKRSWTDVSVHSYSLEVS